MKDHVSRATTVGARSATATHGRTRAFTLAGSIQ